MESVILKCVPLHNVGLHVLKITLFSPLRRQFSLYFSIPFQVPNKSIDFHEIFFYEYYATGLIPQRRTFQFPADSNNMSDGHTFDVGNPLASLNVGS